MDPFAFHYTISAKKSNHAASYDMLGVDFTYFAGNYSPLLVLDQIAFAEAVGPRLPVARQGRDLVTEPDLLDGYECG